LNRECERILKKTAFLTVEDSLQLAAGIFNRRSSGGFQQQPMNEWNLSEVQKKSELPEIYFHTPNFRFDGVISTAKRSDAHLRTQIGRKDARSHTAFQEKAV
jgi:hypothetical protein